MSWSSPSQGGGWRFAGETAFGLHSPSKSSDLVTMVRRSISIHVPQLLNDRLYLRQLASNVQMFKSVIGRTDD